MNPDNGRANITRAFGAMFIAGASGILAHHFSFTSNESLSLMVTVLAGAFCLTAKVR